MQEKESIGFLTLTKQTCILIIPKEKDFRKHWEKRRKC